MEPAVRRLGRVYRGGRALGGGAHRGGAPLRGLGRAGAVQVQADDPGTSGYVENAFDNVWSDGTFGESFDGSPYPQYVFGPSRPRTAGIRASYSF